MKKLIATVFTLLFSLICGLSCEDLAISRSCQSDLSCFENEVCIDNLCVAQADTETDHEQSDGDQTDSSTDSVTTDISEDSEDDETHEDSEDEEDSEAEEDSEVISSVSVKVRANTDLFQHIDGISGQTPLFSYAGVRSLRFLRDPDDQAPLTLFDHNLNSEVSDFIEAGYNDGDETVVATFPAGDLIAGRYTMARMVQTYSRYQVAVINHVWAEVIPGILTNLQVMSDNTLIDGELRNAGYYESVFEDTDGNESFYSGDDWEVPLFSFTSGSYAVIENGEWAFYFPIDVEFSEELEIAAIIINVNMFESFRWRDQLIPGYEDGAFDITPISYEPVERFGGNLFEVSVE